MQALITVVLPVAAPDKKEIDALDAATRLSAEQAEQMGLRALTLTHHHVTNLCESLSSVLHTSGQADVLRSAINAFPPCDVLFVPVTGDHLAHLSAWKQAFPELGVIVVVTPNTTREALDVTQNGRRIVLPARRLKDGTYAPLVRSLLNQGVDRVPDASDHSAVLFSSLRLRQEVQSLRSHITGTTLSGRTRSFFDEDRYLFHNPDVAAAVNDRLLSTGYHHWIQCGHREGRSGAPWTEIDRHRFLAHLQARPFGANLYGFLSTPSGLGNFARGMAKALTACDLPFRPVDIPFWPADAERVAPSQPERFRINIIQQNADAMSLFTRTYGTNVFEGHYNIAYWFWELPSVRSEWYECYQNFDEIWVATEFCRSAFQCLTKLPVTIIPPVVADLDRKAVYGRDHFGFSDGVFVFCYVFDVNSYIDRKNPLCLIRAFRNEFGDSPSVLLFLKLSNTDWSKPQARAIQEAVSGAPNIRIFDGIMDEREVISLHNSIDCFVSPHRSEGFGYNLAESMYFGKPVIATGYSGNLDFMDDENSYLIDYTLSCIRETAGPYAAGFAWAEPSVDHLRKLLRTVFEERDQAAAKGGRAAAGIRRRYSAEAVGRAMLARFGELGLDRPRVSRNIFGKQHGPVQSRFFHPDVPAEVAGEIRRFRHKPTISVITPVYNVDPKWLRRCIESVRAQWYPVWELCLCDDASTDLRTVEMLEHYRGIDPRIKIIRNDVNSGIAGASNRAVEMSSGEYVAMLDNDDEITPDCLLEIAKAAQQEPFDLLYTDEDKIDENGEFCEHYFKPDFSPEHLRSVMYILHILTVRKQVFYQVGGFRAEYSGSQDYDLALRVSEIAKRVVHIPKVLYHWRRIPGSAAAVVDAKPVALQNARKALESHVERCGLDATVEDGKLPGLFRVRHRIAGEPLASLLVIAGDTYRDIPGRGRISLVAHTARSIAEKTAYRNFEIVLVADDEFSEPTRKALAGVPHRVVRYSKPDGPFNFARKVNFAFRQAHSNLVVLLNDDLEVISPDWLGALLEFSQQKEIGAAGARLLFADGRIQHVGMAMGVNGGATHVYGDFPGDYLGYNFYTHIIRNYSAVTAACLATRLDVMEDVGGFDERLAVDYNDVDFCLRVLHRGYRIVYTPYAELYHFEHSSLQRTSQNPDEVKFFCDRWGEYIKNDPYYNPNLTRSSADLTLAADADWPRRFTRRRADYVSAAVASQSGYCLSSSR